MSDRININDIQAFLRDTNVAYYLKTNREKTAYKKYCEVYHELLDAKYKKREYESLRIHLKSHSQKTIDNVKEIVELDKEIQILELQLEDMEQSKLFQNIHYRALHGTEDNVTQNFDKRSIKWIIIFTIIPIIIVLSLLSAWIENFLMVLLFSVFLAIPILPLGFLILFFLIQWIIGKEKMKKYGTFITITLLIILIVICFILSAMVV